MSAGRRNWPSMNSRRTCSGVAACCAAKPPTWYGRSSMAGCWRTTQCAGCCMREQRDIEYRTPSCPSPATYSFCDANRLHPGLSPPTRPTLRRRHFALVLQESARLRATRTVARRSPRMLKRRNSPYASYNPAKPRRVVLDCTPQLLPPGRLTKSKRPSAKAPPLWSPSNPSGLFMTQS